MTTAPIMSEGLFWVICTMTDTAIDWEDSWELHPLFVKSDAISHKDAWAQMVQPGHREYRQCAYNHYPRGRVVVRNGRATVFLSQHIAVDSVVAAVCEAFRVDAPKVHAEGSAHYRCRMDV